MKRRPLIFWLLLAVAIAATIWWALHVPRDPRALYRAIPANATWLSVHSNLAARWPDLAANPLLTSVAGALGIETKDWADQSTSAGTTEFLNRLARDELCIAYVPEMRMTGRPAWVFSSWLGGGSQRFRWTLKSIKDPTLRRAASRNGWSVWVWTPKGMKSGERITFALVEGMLVGCIAADTLGIEDVLACYDGHIPSVAQQHDLMLPPPASRPDRGWLRIPQSYGWGPPIRYSFTVQPGGALAGTVLTEGGAIESRPPVPANELDDFSRLMRDHPVGALVLDRSLAQRWVRQSFRNPVGREIARLLEGDGPGSAAVALVGGPYSGRFMAVRLPTLLAAISSADPAQSARRLGDAFDRLNSAFPWGLVPQPVTVGTQRVFAIESTGRSPYASLDSAERVAYVPLQQNLVFSSNLETLIKLLRESGAPAETPGRFETSLRRMREGAALGYLWMDLDDGAKLLRLAVTAWSLKLLVEDPQGSQPMRQRLNEVKAWIDTLAPLRTLQIWVRPQQDQLEYEFQLGGDS